MAQITDERLAKILSETQETIMEHNARCARGSVEVNARLFESLLMELQFRRKSAELESRTVTVKLPAACADDEYFNDGVFQPMRYERDVERALRAAGIQVIEGEA
ncbi:hypothetical protein [Klebsiella oxytoca]|uniref:hypothetical protein n=1 Tax=Klebsiella oxytoca TaxID=571 RepID=UPI001B324298|nr:hypothetical protein [Klebsiella oxytoca]